MTLLLVLFVLSGLALISPYRPVAANDRGVAIKIVPVIPNHRRPVQSIGVRFTNVFLPGRKLDDVLTRSIGLGIVGCVIGMLFSFFTAVVFSVLLAISPSFFLYKSRRKFHSYLESDLVGFCDVLDLAASGGVGVVNALDVASKEHEGPVSTLVSDSIARISAGVDFDESLLAMAELSDGVLGPFCRTIRDSYRYGSPIRQAIVIYRDELDEARKTKAEAKARRAPTMMIFPLVFCLMPAFILLTISPLLASELYQLRELFRW